MPIVLKTRREIELMRHAGQVGQDILQKMKDATVAGVTTGELDQLAASELAKAGGIGMSRNYPTYKEGEGFPGHTCISVNEEVVHGIPNDRVLQGGDVVTLDMALKVGAFCCDMAITVGVGVIAPRTQKLLDVTQQTLDLAIAHIKPGKKWSEIARLMQYNVEKAGFSVVREFVGDFKLRPGMTIAVEPMVVMGRRDVELLSDGWTVVTEDRKPAAHFEHTIAVTETGVEVLSLGGVPVAAAG